MKLAIGACILLVALLVKSAAQMCNELKTITRTRHSLIVNTRQSRLCIQCLNNGVPLAGVVVWTGQGGPQNNFQVSDGLTRAGLEYVNGILVFVQPMMFIQDGIEDALMVTCADGTIRYDDSEIISDIFLPGQILQSSPLIVNESDSVLLECIEFNPGALESNPEPPQGWFDINGNWFGNTVRRNLRLPNISRNQAGNYTCFTRDRSRTFLNTSIEVIVQYAPEVNSSTMANDNVFLGDTLTLSCVFVGVPTPMVTWIHNDLVLNASDPEVSITTTDTTSQLVRTNIERNGWGIYRCITTNLLGSATAIVYPPDPVIKGPPRVTEGEEAVLTCFSPLIALGSDITWSFNRTSNLPPSFKLSRNNLIISNVRLEHEGSYSCTIEGTTGNFTLDVQPRIPPGDSLPISATIGIVLALLVVMLILVTVTIVLILHCRVIQKCGSKLLQLR